jgi:23S rRNA (cytosine1962-C5)-methyltransferase
MFSVDQYELLDFGAGRKLERFGDHVLDRPSLAARGPARLPAERWRHCAARYYRQGSGGRWEMCRRLPGSWPVRHGDLVFDVGLTDFGHVGLFAEQATNWDWMARVLARRSPCRLLNLFAYTGGSTLTAARHGAEVTHVDAARKAVAWARSNARRSQLGERGVRWIVEDARRFVRREIRRGNRYDGIILDPPSYGHGPKGEAWKLSRNLLPLLRSCRELLSERPVLLLLTCHTPEYRAPELSAALADCIFGHCGAGVTARRLEITTADGRRLPSGYVARWPA